MKAILWKLIHKWRDATTTEAAWIARDQIDIELDKAMEHKVERDALALDAERYRWIHVRPEWLGWDEDFDHRDIDAIVDRAMKGES